MRGAPLTDRQKTDKGLYGSYAPRVRGREVTGQSQNELWAKRGGAAMKSKIGFGSAMIVLVAVLLGVVGPAFAVDAPAGKAAPAPAKIAPGVTAPLPATSALPGYFLIQTVLKKNYLTAVGGGGRITDVIHTNATQPRSWERFRLIPYPQVGGSSTPGSFAIQTASGNYLTAVSGGGRTTDVLHTDATRIAAWEKFSLQVLTNPGVYGAYAIRTGNGRNYLTATGGGGHNTDPPAVHTDATNVGSWEMFWLLASGDPGSGIMYRISTRPGCYLLANRGGGQTTNAILDTCTSKTPWSDENTRFRPIRQGDGTYALQTIDGHFITAVSGGGRTTDVLHTDALQVQAWEKFSLRDQGNGTYTIQTVKGNYLGSGPEVISTNITDPNFASRFGLIMYNF